VQPAVARGEIGGGKTEDFHGRYVLPF
jgi:hypothetical protein